MPFHFQVQPYSSFDPTSQVTIPRPRIAPTVLANGQQGTEYQFALYRGDDRVGGLGFEGWDELSDIEGRRIRTFFFDLRSSSAIKSMLDYKVALGSSDDDFVYVEGLAQGLVLSCAGRIDNGEALHYAAISTLSGLVDAGVAVPDRAVQPDGIAVLAYETSIATLDSNANNSTP